MSDEPQEKVDKAIKEFNEDLQEHFKRVGELEEEISELKEAGKGAADQKQKVAEMSKDFAEKLDDFKEQQTERLDDFETQTQKKLDNIGARPQRGIDLREGVKGLVDDLTDGQGNPVRGTSRFSFKSWDQLPATKEVTDLAGSGGPLEREEEVPGIVGPGERQLTIRDLLPTAQTSEALVRFSRELSVTDNAQTQEAQGDTKGESDFTFEAATEDVVTVAHFVRVSQQLLNDVTALESYISSRMRFLLNQEEEDQLLTGSGSGAPVELNGIKPQATAFDTTLDDDVTALNRMDVLRAAILQVSLAHYPATGIILHPTDWFLIETSKDADNRYQFASPQNMATPRMWGLPVTATTAQTSDEFTVGAFQLGAQIWDRMNAAVELSTEDADNFVRNMVTIRAERREALTVYRPESFVDGDFSVALTGS